MKNQATAETIKFLLDSAEQGMSEEIQWTERITIVHFNGNVQSKKNTL